MKFFVVWFIILPAFEILQSAVCYGKILVHCLYLKSMIYRRQQPKLQLILTDMYTLQYIQVVQEYRYMERSWHGLHKPNTTYFYAGRCCHPRCSKQSLLLCPHTKRDCEIQVRLLLPKSCGRTYVGVCLSFHALLFRILDIIVSFPVRFLHFTFGKRFTSSNTSWGGGYLGPRIFWIFGPEKNLLNSTLQGFDKVVWLTETIYLFWTLSIV